MTQELDKHNGWLLDGFPRRRSQAQALLESASPSLVLNLALRQEVLVDKCLGRRLCSKCGKNWNIANIYLPAGVSRVTWSISGCAFCWARCLWGHEEVGVLHAGLQHPECRWQL